MRHQRIAQETPVLRTNDVFYTHFPELRSILLDRLEGRSATPLLALIDKNFLAGWSIKMRYAPTTESLARPLDDWAKQAAQAVNLMSGVGR